MVALDLCRVRCQNDGGRASLVGDRRSHRGVRVNGGPFWLPLVGGGRRRQDAWKSLRTRRSMKLCRIHT
jgi:hypothetical protein